MAWAPHAGVDPGDLGRGVVFLQIVENKEARDLEDTLMLRSSADSGAPPVGSMLLTVSADGEPTYRVAAPDMGTAASRPVVDEPRLVAAHRRVDHHLVAILVIDGEEVCIRADDNLR